VSKAFHQEIPFNQLFRSAQNARRTGLQTEAYLKGVEKLAASIYSTHQQTGRGLLQNLVVHPVDSGFAVDAGGRRHAAVGLLIEQGKLPADYPCPCNVIGADDATAASLAENVQREAMHPADEFDAFLELTEQGWTLDKIADSFGVTTLVVERRLKLRAAAPALLEEYRDGQLTTDQLIGLCSTDNHALQVEVWNRVRGQHYGNDQAALRRAVTSTEVVASSDLRVPFIGGIEIYEKAGGVVRRDLFSSDGNGAILTDSALLDSLVHATIESQAAELRSEGWSWLEIWPKYDYTAMDRFGRVPTIIHELSPESEAKKTELQTELAQVQAAIEDLGADEAPEKAEQLEAREEALTSEIEQIEESREGYSTKMMGHAGIVLCYERGQLRIERGLLRASDRASVAALLEDGQRIFGGRESEPTGRKADTISEALRCSLLAHRNMGAQFATAANPKAAKILLVCKFVTDIRDQHGATPTDMGINNGYGTRTFCKITDDAGLARQNEFAEQGVSLIEALPADYVELWDTLAAMTDIELDALLAYSVARSVSLPEKISGLSEKYLSVVGFAMADHFTTTAANYLGRVSKELILEALTEAGKVTDENDRAALLGLKKGALAKEAETRLTGTSWVPALIRSEAPVVTKKPVKAGKPKALAKA